MTTRPPSHEPAPGAPWIAVSAAFGALGRAFLCLNDHFEVLHASSVLDDLLGRGASARAAGRPVEQLLGADLFGPAAPLRQALAASERREGWRASLRPAEDGPPRLVSVTAAPIDPPPGACDPEVAYIVVLRPAEDEPDSAGSAVTFGGLTARSAAMAGIFRLIENLDHSEATVLLTGESGTGKEMVARALHDHSPRRRGPFVAVNCGARLASARARAPASAGTTRRRTSSAWSTSPARIGLSARATRTATSRSRAPRPSSTSSPPA